MFNLLNVYDCPKCGEVLSDQVSYHEEHTDCGVYAHRNCDKCKSPVTERLSCDIQTRQVMHHYEEVDDERARWAHGFYDETEDDEDDYCYRHICSTCGGETTEDYSTCWCGIYDEEDHPNSFKCSNCGEEVLEGSFSCPCLTLSAQEDDLPF